MIIPVRCFTCGKVIANKWEVYNKKVQDAEKEKEKGADCSRNIKESDDNSADSSLHQCFDSSVKGKILDQLGLTKICCRRHMLGHVDLIDMI